MAHPPIYIGGSLDQANDALFGITIMPRVVMLTFMFYGLPEADALAVQSRWTEVVRSALTTKGLSLPASAAADAMVAS